MAESLFQIHTAVQGVPFIAGRNLGERRGNMTIVTRVRHRGRYGDAFGVPIDSRGPNEHFEYDPEWVRTGKIPCCGCYQWRLVETPPDKVESLLAEYRSKFGHKYPWLCASEQEAEPLPRPRARPVETGKKIYLDVPFGEKEYAKKAGAKWDPACKRWYIPDWSLLEGVRKWLPPNTHMPKPADPETRETA